MANIRVDTSYTIIDGSEIVFVAPCNCTAITGVKVYYPGGSKVFTFKDAHGNDLSGIGNLFSAGAYVKAILDTKNGHAYIQNADTNAYLEGRFNGTIVVPVTADITLGAAHAGKFLRVDDEAIITIPADIFPVGVELEVFSNTEGMVSVATGADVFFVAPGYGAPVPNDRLLITVPYSSAVLKQISPNVWSIQGAI